LRWQRSWPEADKAAAYLETTYSTSLMRFFLPVIGEKKKTVVAMK